MSPKERLPRPFWQGFVWPATESSWLRHFRYPQEMPRHARHPRVGRRRLPVRAGRRRAAKLGQPALQTEDRATEASRLPPSFDFRRAQPFPGLLRILLVNQPCSDLCLSVFSRGYPPSVHYPSAKVFGAGSRRPSEPPQRRFSGSSAFPSDFFLRFLLLQPQPSASSLISNVTVTLKMTGIVVVT